MAKNLIDEIDEDSQIDIILKNAINFAYLNIATTIDKKVTTKEIPYSKVTTLPEDFNTLIEAISGEEILNSLDYSLKSNVMIFHKKYDTINLVYTKTIPPLSVDTDELQIDNRYCFACAMYGAYAYSVHRKRTELASLLLSDYNNILTNRESKKEVNENDTNRSN